MPFALFRRNKPSTAPELQSRTDPSSAAGAPVAAPVDARQPATGLPGPRPRTPGSEQRALRPDTTGRLALDNGEASGARHRAGQQDVRPRGGTRLDAKLRAAVRAGDTFEVATLLSQGADPNAKSRRHGNTALNNVVRARDTRGVHDAITATLLTHGADPSIGNKDGENALHVLAREVSEPAFQSVLQAVEDRLIENPEAANALAATDRAGRTPLKKLEMLADKASRLAATQASVGVFSSETQGKHASTLQARLALFAEASTRVRDGPDSAEPVSMSEADKRAIQYFEEFLGAAVLLRASRGDGTEQAPRIDEEPRRVTGSSGQIPELGARRGGPSNVDAKEESMLAWKTETLLNAFRQKLGHAPDSRDWQRHAANDFGPFVSHVAKHGELGQHQISLSASYVKRLSEDTVKTIPARSLFVGCMFLARKYLDDFPPRRSDWAIFTGLSEKQLLEIELNILKDLNFAASDGEIGPGRSPSE